MFSEFFFLIYYLENNTLQIVVFEAGVVILIFTYQKLNVSTVRQSTLSQNMY